MFRVHPVSSTTEFPFVCSFQRPPTCPAYVPPTTTVKPTQTKTPVTKPTHKTTTTTRNPSTGTGTTTTTSPLTTPPPDVLQCHIKEKIHGFIWPPALPSKFSRVPCPKNWSGTGGEWKCGENGQFIDKPEINCVSIWLDPMMKRIGQTTDIKSLENVSLELSEKMGETSFGIKFHGDLHKASEMVQAIQHLTDRFVEHLPGKEVEHSVKNITHSVVRTCSKMLAQEDAWKSGRRDETVNIAESVLRYIQYAGVTFGCSEASLNKDMKLETIVGEHDSEEQPNIYMSAFNMDHQQPISFSFNDQKFSLTNTIENNVPVSSSCNHQIGVGAVFDKLSKYLSFDISDKDLLINSEIVAFNYNNKTTTFELPNSTYAKMEYVLSN